MAAEQHGQGTAPVTPQQRHEEDVAVPEGVDDRDPLLQQSNYTVIRMDADPRCAEHDLSVHIEQHTGEYGQRSMIEKCALLDQSLRLMLLASKAGDRPSQKPRQAI
jgi:hypothetical protein